MKYGVKSKERRVMKTLVKYLLALVFILSAVMKLIDFRNTINFYSGVLSISFVLSKTLVIVLIAVELMFSVFTLNKLVKINAVFYLIMAVLILLTAISVWFWAKGINNCGCFGTIIVDKPAVSVIKNVLLFVALIVLRKNTVRVNYA